MVMVNFMYQLDWVTDAHCSKSLFLYVPVRGSAGEMNTKSGGLSKTNGLPNVGGQSVEGLIRIKN